MMDVTHRWNTSCKPMAVGFLLSLLLTLGAWLLVTERVFALWPLMGAVAGLGTLQALVQLIFFLNLGIEHKPRWNLMMFIFMVIVMIVIIGGSMWIMYHLNYNMMPSMEHMEST